VKRYSTVTAIWYRVFWLLRGFLGYYLGEDQLHAATAYTCALWFQMAADGVETTQGAYRALWGAAEHVLAKADPMHMLGTADDVEGRIPLDMGHLPCDVARLYAAIWQAAQQCEWDRATIHRISKRISKMIPTDLEEWYETEPAPIDDPVARHARRAFAVMYEHECDDNPVCAKSGDIWAREDQANDRWIETERLAREGI